MTTFSLTKVYVIYMHILSYMNLIYNSINKSIIFSLSEWQHCIINILDGRSSLKYIYWQYMKMCYFHGALKKGLKKPYLRR
jgi:hypothetical protein